ncbi:MAG: molybdopterin-dependent oxidoreductase [Bacteroidetes bacterium]|nr:molybdopterin-dependent oxidoreductase [Bacteroidota bacterium]MBS1980293.1 molybdopterin-dependent oxidoreductase [Bacteroidota bacterium]
MFIGVNPSVFVILGIILIATVGAAWIQFLVAGLPKNLSPAISLSGGGVKGFPWWLILCHWLNFFFISLLIRSGLSILMDHPRLYWNNGCTPGSEWIKFTPVQVPKDRVWTAKDDARYISPVIGLPGYRHTIGLARGWHFIHVPFFVFNGVVFVSLLFAGNQWQKIVPHSWQIFPDAWSVFVHYATFHLPAEMNGFYQYNALQQLSYFGAVFILAPLAMLSGLCMSPAIENRFHWLPKLFGNRQGARSMHFLVMLGYVVFIIVHVTMVAATGLVRNMNHITLGTDSTSDLTGLSIGLTIVLFAVAFCFYAHWVSWNRPRWVQHGETMINGNLWQLTLNKLKPREYFKKEDISPFFWPNGKLPVSEEWKKLAENNFNDYKLKVGGLVENKIELSLDDLKRMGKSESITMHHCIQGWSGIAAWGGLPLKEIIKLVNPHPSVTTVAFYSFGEGLYGGKYYDTHTLDNCLKPGSILAWEMNDKPLPQLYGAPLRLRIENQLGYKQVKWIDRIEFVETHKTIGKGYGGKNEDDEYFDLIANT